MSLLVLIGSTELKSFVVETRRLFYVLQNLLMFYSHLAISLVRLGKEYSDQKQQAI